MAKKHQGKKKQHRPKASAKKSSIKKESSEGEANGKRRGSIDLSAWNFNRELEATLFKLGLKLKDMTGDGNCLFRSLSDQIHGNPANHFYIRTRVVQHISRNKELYEPFLAFEEEGGFDAHVSRMATDGCYGGNIELVAFAREFNVEVMVHQANEPVWIIQPDLVENAGQEKRIRAHVAYHSWEHYSSVRNIDGPFEGPAEIVIKLKDTPNDSSSNKPDSSTATINWPPNSLEITILKSVGLGDVDRGSKKLKECRGDPNRVINELYEEMEKKWEDAEAENQADVGNEDVDLPAVENQEPMSGVPNGAADAGEDVPENGNHHESKDVVVQQMEDTPDIAELPTTDAVPRKIATTITNPTNQGRKLSNREKKEAAKKARKENAVSKKRKDAALSSTNVMAPTSNVGTIIDGMNAISI